MQKKPSLLLICIGLLTSLVIIPAQVNAQSGSGSDLLAAVNAFRIANGYSAYQSNSALMSSAQAHSQYQASIGTWTHTGADGSNETQRAIAAGYGGGGTVWCDEAVATGPDLSPQGAIDLWQDAVHLAILLSPNFVDAGGGAAIGDGWVYYTLDACYISSSGGLPAPTSPPVTTPLPTPLPIFPVVTATPRSDGAVIHVVQPGQTLIAIAEAYGVKLADILAYNSLNEKTVIFPGDALLIRLPSTTVTPQMTGTTTPLAGEEATFTPTPTPSRQPPTATPTAKPPTATAVVVTPAAPLGGPVSALPSAAQRENADYLLLTIIVLGSAGTLLIVLGNALKRSG